MAKRSLCLVTGGAGFIGSHLVEALLRRNYRVKVLDNLSTGKMENLAHIRKGDLVLIRGDICRDRDIQKAVRHVDYIFHLAANRAVLRSVDDPLQTHEVNGTGTLKLLLAARRARIKRFIFSSSSSIYGNTHKFPSRETDPPNPASPYAASKILGEYYCRQFTALYGLSTVSLRYFNVFGPRQNPESRYSAVIPIFIDCLLKGIPPTVHWDGRQSRDFSYVDNVVFANLLAMRAPRASGEVFNIACHEEYSVLDILRQLQKILGVRGIRPRFTPKRPGDVRRTFADISKAKRILGYRVLVRFEEGLEKTVAWFLQKRQTKQ